MIVVGISMVVFVNNLPFEEGIKIKGR